MINLHILIYKSTVRIKNYVLNYVYKFLSVLKMKGNNINFQNFKTSGIPYISIALRGSMSIGKNFVMNNGIKGNPIGCYNKCTFFVARNAKLTIGENVGISQTALICHKNITIGNYVKIGGGVKIYDTDFHSLDPLVRAGDRDQNEKKMFPVVIEDYVFIGAYSIILKGVTIGKNSIIGAGSVVTKSVPKNQIWAGNPAKFIRNL